MLWVLIRSEALLMSTTTYVLVEKYEKYYVVIPSYLGLWDDN